MGGWLYYDLVPFDSTGAKWVNWGGSVYKSWHGLWAKIAPLSAFGSPFRDGRRILAIYTDPRGRLFFQTRPDITVWRLEIVAWKPPVSAPPPAPNIQVTPFETDAVTIRITTPLRSKHQIIWRVNGGEWQVLQGAKAIRLSNLPQGDYRVEAQTLDSLLQASPQSAVAVFSIRSVTTAQIAACIKTLLTGSDDARNRAATLLVKQSDAALPALQAARPGASELGQWWIDAVMQEIKQAKLPGATGAPAP